ncbi:MAG: aminomethyl-transferring glycine dehydrogenase subunit GcvPB [Actinomycetota bacterium]|nr:aminomethyl-transferring glycine dehydrogenase subunit GcvPB [Actinomycetota bacterium]MDH5223272.1 aminomethyl-transferring glycine dehydrogenase subunit GcvPB [Actinomycetota bacterium]
MTQGAPIRTRGPAASSGTIAEHSSAGRRASSFAPLDVPVASVPPEHRRPSAPKLPQVAEIDLVRHYTRLSQQNYGVDTGPYPLGSCTMKYNPKVAETVAALPGFQRAHPLQPDATVQGTLEMLWRLERALCEITGMARATLQPPAGACGEMTGLLIMRAFHADAGRERTKVLIPDAAHGTNPASVRLAGFEAVNVPSDDRGLVDVDALRELLDDEVAGLMLTNPNTLGLFEERIEEITASLHAVNALVYYDGANLNAIMGKTRPGDMGFDIVHINTHKTFATPHGGGGPGAGPVGVASHLVDYLPSPIVARDADTFRWDRDRPKSIGRLHGFNGNIGVLVRAYAYVFGHGGDGLTEVSEMAALNANYLAVMLAPAFPFAYPDSRPMHEFVATAGPLKKATGVRAMDVAKRLIDLGYHPSTVYFPLVVDEALMIEPTETESKQTLDAMGAAFVQAAEDAHTDPGILHDAPVTTPVRRLDEARAARQLRLRWGVGVPTDR